MFSKPVLINTSNIHGGGALQVAISFFTELAESNDKLENLTFAISSKIKSELSEDIFLKAKFKVIVFDSHGFNCLFSKLNFTQFDYDAVFTLFGPKYTLRKAKIDIVGFAQPWIISSDSFLFDSLSFLDKFKNYLKYNIQKYFFFRSDHIVVELKHVKDKLSSIFNIKNEKISVVHNTLSSLYFNKEYWQPVNFDLKPDSFSIGFVTRAYPHKNIKVLPRVARILRDIYKIPVVFYLTLNEDEWSNYKDDFSELGCTIGSISVYQCPSFYEKMDAVIFPSLLECFSAAPLEALYMEKPLFASDRGFVKDICKDFASYFDPNDPHSIASTIASYFLDSSKKIEASSAKDYVKNFSSSKERCNLYLNIIKQFTE